jgi:hypothetical protein
MVIDVIPLPTSRWCGSASPGVSRRSRSFRELRPAVTTHLCTASATNSPWVAARGISTHWLRHTTLPWVERHSATTLPAPMPATPTPPAQPPPLTSKPPSKRSHSRRMHSSADVRMRWAVPWASWLVTTKTGRQETVEELETRIREAARHVPLERLALSPQCGFATSILGNALTAADQQANSGQS